MKNTRRNQRIKGLKAYIKSKNYNYKFEVDKNNHHYEILYFINSSDNIVKVERIYKNKFIICTSICRDLNEYGKYPIILNFKPKLK